MRRAFAAIATAAVVVVACNEDGPNEPDLGTYTGNARSACSTGPAHASESDLEVSPSSTNGLETCTPRCGVTATDSLAAVPSGACSVGGEMCVIDVRNACATGSRTDAIRCDCLSEQWQCVVAAQGCAADGG